MVWIKFIEETEVTSKLKEYYRHIKRTTKNPINICNLIIIKHKLGI